MKNKKEIKACSTCKFANVKERSNLEEIYKEFKCTLQNNRLIYDSRQEDKECELDLYETE